MNMSPFFANHGNRGGSKKSKSHPVESCVSPTTCPLTHIEKSTPYSGGENVKRKDEVSETFHAHKKLPAQACLQKVGGECEKPIPTYYVGDEVLLSTKNFLSSKAVRRLSQPYMGPFRISKVINSLFYQLELPDDLDPLYNAFHVSLLIPVPKDPLLNLTKAPAPLKAIDSTGKKLWAIDNIVDAKRPDGKLYYFIRWTGSVEREKLLGPLSNLFTAVITKEMKINGQNVTQRIYILLL